MSKKIIKHGKYYIGKIKYRCSICLCEFLSEPDRVESTLSDDVLEYVSKCPECGHRIASGITKKSIDNKRASLKRKGVSQ